MWTERGSVPKVASPAFLPSPLIKLDPSVTGPDYLRFLRQYLGDEGPFSLWRARTRRFFRKRNSRRHWRKHHNHDDARRDI